MFIDGVELKIYDNSTFYDHAVYSYLLFMIFTFLHISHFYQNIFFMLLHQMYAVFIELTYIHKYHYIV